MFPSLCIYGESDVYWLFGGKSLILPKQIIYQTREMQSRWNSCKLGAQVVKRLYSEYLSMDHCQSKREYAERPAGVSPGFGFNMFINHLDKGAESMV